MGLSVLISMLLWQVSQTMKHCEHTHWLSFYQNNDAYLAVSDRLQNITKHIPNPDVQKPSLLVLIGNATKQDTLKVGFGIKARWLRTKRSKGEIHLHIDPSSIFHERPIIIGDSDIASSCKRNISSEKCHEIAYKSLQRRSKSSVDQYMNGIYSQLLLPFVDVFCFFADDLGGFEPIAHHLATWLEQSHIVTLPESARPRVAIVTDKIPLGGEIEAKKTFLWLLAEETSKDVWNQISEIDIIALLPHGSISANARQRLLKDRLMKASDHGRRDRQEAQMLFSVSHFTEFLKIASKRYSTLDDEPLNLILASRAYNHLASDVEEHITNLLIHIKSAGELTKFAAPIIASSILFDTYPPNSHRKFCYPRCSSNGLIAR
jgi:hypothetical protein